MLEAVSDPAPDGGWVLTFTDITAERHGQAELERARDAAELAPGTEVQVMVAAGEFTADVTDVKSGETR